MITIEGVRLNVSLEALEQGEGFLVRLNTNWNTGQDDELRRASRKAQELDVMGQRLNGHEATYADAKTAIATAIDNFETDLTSFITDWNNGVYEN